MMDGHNIWSQYNNAWITHLNRKRAVKEMAQELNVDICLCESPQPPSSHHNATSPESERSDDDDIMIINSC